ncbi:MAG: glycosyltransferase family 2 protein [candidate division KSB1 bacterium]|nr:glycosyltransferase family 2 protein [candidate division KSB1 bacterium]
MPNTLNDISVVIPAFNEEESIPELVKQLTRVLSKYKFTYELLFIDDGSSDSTTAVIRGLEERDSHIKLIAFRRNYGKSAALSAGFGYAAGRYIITMDADLQDDPEEIPKLVNKLEEGWDLVSGWKKKRYDPFSKRILSKIYNFFTSVFSGIRLHDFNCGLKAYRIEVAKSLNVYGELHRYLPVIAFRNGFRVTEMAVQHHERKYGVSKFGAARLTRGAFDLLTITFLTKYKKRPLHLFGLWGGISFFLGFIVLFLLAFQKIVYDAHLSDRPLLFLGVLLVIVGIQFFSIGLLGEMITESRRDSAPYLIKETVGLEDQPEA